MKKIPLLLKLSCGLLYGLLCAFAFAQSDNPVSVRVDIYVVSEVDGQESLTAASTARPGQIVEYRLYARNDGDTTLPAGTVVITGPVPEGTTFVANTATPSSESLLTEYSINGETYGEPPLIVETDTAERTVAEPGLYKAVRWTLLEPMQPGSETAFIYRVVVGDA